MGTRIGGLRDIGVIIPKLSGRSIAEVGMGISKEGGVEKGFLAY
jgi:hypothetical protein